MALRLFQHRKTLFANNHECKELLTDFSDDIKNKNFDSIHQNFIAFPIFYFTVKHYYSKQDQNTLRNFLETVERDITIFLQNKKFFLYNTPISIDRKAPKPSFFSPLPKENRVLKTPMRRKDPNNPQYFQAFNKDLNTMSDEERKDFTRFLKMTQQNKAMGNTDCPPEIPLKYHNVGMNSMPIISIENKKLYISAAFASYDFKTVLPRTINSWVRDYPKKPFRIAFQEEVILDQYLEKYDNVSANESLFARNYKGQSETPVIIENRYYESQKLAANDLNINTSTLNVRVNDPNIPTWRKATLEEIKQKRAYNE